MTPVEKIAAAVLYEGYVLWPYRRSARKNQKRWTFGGVYPQAYSQHHPDDPWLMQTQCLVQGTAPRVTVTVRFLQVVERQVQQRQADGALAAVDTLAVAGERYLSWDEATERELTLTDLRLSALHEPYIAPLQIAAGKAVEPLSDGRGNAVGALERRWQALAGTVTVAAQAVDEDLYQLTVTITNQTPWQGADREATLRQTLVATHTMLSVKNGAFISMTDPPIALQPLAAVCKNLHTWPVLVGEEGERQTMLSSPIILSDYPQIAPESSGDFFDGGEIDQMLLLNILTLTDEEKAEMRATDPRTREILERSEAMTSDDFMRLHGTIREFRQLSG